MTYNLEKFLKGLEELQIELSENQIQQFIKYYEMLVEKNKVMNLTAITEFDEVIEKHFLDSLSLIKVYDLQKEVSVMDMGTGAGFPGIPLKIAFPNLRMTLADSLNKRILFLQEVIEKLGLKDIDALHARAEELGKNKEYREKFDLVVSRAVANLSSLEEYCVPFVKIGGNFISYKSGNIIAFMDNLMNSYLYGTRFDEISELIYNTINGKNYLEKMEAETLVDCNIFAGVDKLLISWIIGRLENEDIGAKLNGKTITELCVVRRKGHFGKNFRSEYFILQNAFDMIAEGKYQPVSGIKNLVKEYMESTYKIDRYYRYFYFYFDKLEDTTQFEKIRELVENIYTNEYLNQITVNWNNELADADGETGLTLQRDFFARHINYSKDRVVVIISDALRYEVAHTLFEKMQADEKCNASIGAMQGVLPSYTPLGMASLLPHRTIEYSDSYEVLVDGKMCASTEQREAILQEYKVNSKCVQFDAFKNMKQADLRAIFTGQDVVYIYHNQIDARGDKAASENEVFTACEEAIEEIYTLIKRIASQANTYHFIVTADHGFIYKRDKIQATDKIAGAASKSNSVGQRYSISDEEIKADGVCHTTIGKVLGNDDERIVSFPLASDIFKVAGAGQNYVHGGCSAQEMLVPMIDVKVDKGKKETSLAEIALVSLTSKITNLITTLDFVQTEPVSDIVKETSYRVYFIADNNEKISNENIVIADKKDKDTTKRMFRLRFNFKNKKYDKSQKYYLVAYDDKNDIEILRHEIIMDVAFADDFGFFE